MNSLKNNLSLRLKLITLGIVQQQFEFSASQRAFRPIQRKKLCLCHPHASKLTRRRGGSSDNDDDDDGGGGGDCGDDDDGCDGDDCGGGGASYAKNLSSSQSKKRATLSAA